MIVYVETNFVLELARLQEQYRSCEEVLSLAEAAKITLVIPAFSITEARTSLVRLEKQRVEFYNKQLIPHLRELSRSKTYKEIPAKTEPLTKALIESSQEEWNKLESVTSLILSAGQVIPLTSEIVQAAIQNEETLGLEPPDATVYASIIDDLGVGNKSPSCFLNKNSKDFANPDIYAELSQYTCQMIPSFEDGLRYISKRLTK
jgi:hypothetical protein